MDDDERRILIAQFRKGKGRFTASCKATLTQVVCSLLLLPSLQVELAKRGSPRCSVCPTTDGWTDRRIVSDSWQLLLPNSVDVRPSKDFGRWSTLELATVCRSHAETRIARLLKWLGFQKVIRASTSVSVSNAGSAASRGTQKVDTV